MRSRCRLDGATARFDIGRRLAVLAAIAFLPIPVATAQTLQPAWADVGAVFSDRCTMCHSGEGAPAGLRLDTFAAALAGGTNGAVLLAGNPDASELVRRIRGDSLPLMPLVGDPLTAGQVAMIEAWVVAGMPQGDAGPTAAPLAAPAASPLPGNR